ncbi:MAG TPA: helical backbone metal receptor [Burkholderiaceae bacterium]|jgi:ABC-type Fe3+-hydroxamate transport system substrate-binding protein|nr:helical backbone metal receptor [Burkholderiaceae bacterium]HRA77347.1 helical backbone metal receptor [Burkholderiaceae bacterium]
MQPARLPAIAWLLATLVATVPAAAAQPIDAAAARTQATRLAQDDRGRRLALPRAPARIVSLAPHATELLFASGLGARVVAVDRDSDFPEAARALPRVASHPRPDVEELLALAPDLVVIWGPGADRALLERLDALGLAVFVSEPRTLDDVADSIERFARMSSDASVGLAASHAFRARVAAVRQRYANRRPVRVFVQVWSSPLIGVADRDVIGDAVRSCGGSNVLAGSAVAAPRLDAEAVIAARPELILATDGTRSERVWRERGLLAPRGAARFAAFDASTMERPGPRVLDALDRLCVEIDEVRRAVR